MSYLLEQRARYGKSVEQMDKDFNVKGHDRDPSVEKRHQERIKDISKENRDKFSDERQAKFDKEFQMKKYNLRDK